MLHRRRQASTNRWQYCRLQQINWRCQDCRPGQHRFGCLSRRRRIGTTQPSNSSKLRAESLLTKMATARLYTLTLPPTGTCQIVQFTPPRSVYHKKLIHQFETHPNRDALKADLRQNYAYNPFSEKSQDTRRKALYIVLAELACVLQTKRANWTGIFLMPYRFQTTS